MLTLIVLYKSSRRSFFSVWGWKSFVPKALSPPGRRNSATRATLDKRGEAQTCWHNLDIMARTPSDAVFRNVYWSKADILHDKKLVARHQTKMSRIQFHEDPGGKKKGLCWIVVTQNKIVWIQTTNYGPPSIFQRPTMLSHATLRTFYHLCVQ